LFSYLYQSYSICVKLFLITFFFIKILIFDSLLLGCKKYFQLQQIFKNSQCQVIFFQQIKQINLL
ncbi:hypothetical protein IMG5_066790, partial [Ichthyophthirius multifiliis]